MHELPITKSILDIALQHAALNRATRVLAIHLQIGKLSDLEDAWLQRYFDYLSKGTVAEGAKLKIERMPIMVMCSSCSLSYEAHPENIGNLACPACGATNATLVSGGEYFIKTMEVQ